ncbi:MOSC domain-containing protein [Janibacter limosus]|uniref:MOSC domain-containing protein n=1 Tax=Janibacter limosus TaxID=53458 RepID=UPI0008375005|nr:MOSC N-terminal beta barrel domain-containing protein [Janibacter limosus]
MAVHITRIGLTPLKGARHAALTQVQLDRRGPVGDRVFCLVDVDRARVLRTVEHPRMVLVDARWDGSSLAVCTPDAGSVTGAPEPTGETLVSDYWGRDARLEIMDSPHAEVIARHLGREVRLARVGRPGEVVYGAPVSIVTTGALATLGEQDSSRFRATFTISADHDPEPGTVLALGDAVVRVRGAVPRCRVIDIAPASGLLDRTHLRTLADQAHPSGELPFGVDAEVIVPGLVRSGQPVSVVPS